MAIIKNGMRKNSFSHEASKDKGYDIQAAIEYCKLHGLRIEDLSPAQLAKFKIS